MRFGCLPSVTDSTFSLVPSTIKILLQVTSTVFSRFRVNFLIAYFHAHQYLPIASIF